ncbi:hypothetical protein [Microbacterium sp. MM2322]|uniref:hypothetical protein n=1 Tax=Microbacterium sp. MM2322 TaxID=3157631 RepID=UPI0032D587B9
MLVRLSHPDGVVVGWRTVPETAGSGRTAEARVAGRHLLREALSLLGVADTGIRQRCEVCGGVDHGPLRSDDAAISVAYAPGVVVAAAAHARAIGIDVERDAGTLPGLDALFAPSPPPDAGGWTAIEAALKADGRGLRVDPATVVVADGRARVPDNDRTIAVHRVTGPAGYVVSLAIDPA